jgi:hypothetical protein
MFDERAEWLMGKRNPQDIAYCVWACGRLGIEAPNLFRLLEQRADVLFWNGNPQDLKNCVWACGVLGLESPNLSRLLDQCLNAFSKTEHHKKLLIVSGLVASLESSRGIFWDCLTNALYDRVITGALRKRMGMMYSWNQGSKSLAYVLNIWWNTGVLKASLTTGVLALFGTHLPDTSFSAWEKKACLNFLSNNKHAVSVFDHSCNQIRNESFNPRYGALSTETLV